MTNAQAHEVQMAVRDYLKGPHGQGFDIGNPDHFEQLVADVREHIDDEDIAEDDLRTVVAMCVLHPGAPDIPPAVMREALLSLLPQPEAERLARVMEFAIAYGCGKWRMVQAGYGGWEQRWEGALRALTRALEPAVAKANRWLVDPVVEFPEDRDVPHDRDFREGTAVRSDARALAHRLTRPEHLFHLGAEEALSITCTDDDTRLEVPTQDYEITIPPGAKVVWTIASGSAALRRSGASRKSAARHSAVEEELVLPREAKIIIAADDDETSSPSPLPRQTSSGDCQWVRRRGS